MAGRRLRVALLAGGRSGEREISLQGAAVAAEALDPARFEVKRYDALTELPRLAQEAGQIDFALILLHGLYGEDGTIQGFLEMLDIPYQGSGVLGSAAAMDKDFSKKLYQSAGLPVADWSVIGRNEAYDVAALEQRFGYPVVVKPVADGSSLGMTIAKSRDVLENALRDAVAQSETMVEQYIKGREITVSVLGNRDAEALPVIEIIPGDAFEYFDYEAKYVPGATREVCPAELSPELTEMAQRYGVAAHHALHLRGYSRTDMIIDAENTLYLLETNTIPGMTRTSLFPQAAAAYGLSFSAMLERLIELGLEKK